MNITIKRVGGAMALLAVVVTAAVINPERAHADVFEGNAAESIPASACQPDNPSQVVISNGSWAFASSAQTGTVRIFCPVHQSALEDNQGRAHFETFTLWYRDEGGNQSSASVTARLLRRENIGVSPVGISGTATSNASNVTTNTTTEASVDEALDTRNLYFFEVTLFRQNSAAATVVFHGISFISPGDA